MLTILSQSNSELKLRSFTTSKWRSSNQQANTTTETFWIIRSSTRKFTFIKYLQVKALTGNLKGNEIRLLLDAPGVLQDDLFVDSLRAFQTEIPKEVLWSRLQTLQRFLKKPVWSENLFYTLNNCISYEVKEIRKSIRKVKKFSGWVRNSSAVGSKRRSGTVSPDPESFEWTTNVEIDYYHYLTVGEFNSGLSGLVSITLMSSEERNGNHKNVSK